jgi:hypothetical protein
VECLADVKLYKDLGLTYPGQGLINQGQWVAVLAGKSIKLLKVDIEA